MRACQPPPRTGSGRAPQQSVPPRAPLHAHSGQSSGSVQIASAKASPSRQYDETQLLQLPAGRRRDLRRDGRH